MGHRQIVRNAASDQGLHGLLTECSIKISGELGNKDQTFGGNMETKTILGTIGKK